MSGEPFLAESGKWSGPRLAMPGNALRGIVGPEPGSPNGLFEARRCGGEEGDAFGSN